MSYSIWKPLLTAWALYGALHSSTALATLPPSQRLLELSPAQDGQSVRSTPGAHTYLSTLLDDRATQTLRLVDLHAEAIGPQTRSLSVTLPDGNEVTFERLYEDRSVPGMYGWIGDVPSDRSKRWPSAEEAPMDPLNWISLTRDADQVVGTIQVKGQSYRLEPVGTKLHALVKIDTSQLSPEKGARSELDFDTDKDVGASAQVSAGSTDAPAWTSKLRVLMVTTRQSREKYPNVRLTLTQALQNSNLAMRNSRVKIVYELGGFYDAPYNETGRTYNQILHDFRVDPQVAALRQAYRAHLVSTLAVHPQYCGLAFVNATKATAFSVISCTSSLAHELGHNLGANHNWQPGDAVGNPPYMFGYRYTAGSPRFSTQLSGGCSPACPRVPYFSNPRVTYQGIPVGTVDRHDVARRFEERREGIENWYPPQMQVTTFERPGFEGAQCNRSLQRGQDTTTCNRTKSFKVTNFLPGSKLCFFKDRATWSCIQGAYEGDFQIDDLHAHEMRLPAGLRRERSGSLVFNAQQISYQRQ